MKYIIEKNEIYIKYKNRGKKNFKYRKEKKLNMASGVGG